MLNVRHARAKYGGMDASMIGEMKELAEENRRLKKMYAEKILLFNTTLFRGDYRLDPKLNETVFDR